MTIHEADDIQRGIECWRSHYSLSQSAIRYLMRSDPITQPPKASMCPYCPLDNDISLIKGAVCLPPGI